MKDTRLLAVVHNLQILFVHAYCCRYQTLRNYSVHAIKDIIAKSMARALQTLELLLTWAEIASFCWFLFIWLCSLFRCLNVRFLCWLLECLNGVLCFWNIIGLFVSTFTCAWDLRNVIQNPAVNLHWDGELECWHRLASCSWHGIYFFNINVQK